MKNHIYTFLFSYLAYMAVVEGQIPQINSFNKVVSLDCLECLCETISDCNLTLGCTGSTCGPFAITKPYWQHGGQLILRGDTLDNETQAFENCCNDVFCAGDTIQGYMRTFKQDCNGDGVIDCYDFGAIHTLGPYGCKGEVPQWYGSKLRRCIEKSHK
ncbi:uncharacterized protein Dwil_GK27471 [Drosophila willistoni]|uniref:lysozyme n=1 Tax=Drosophila willistoni TaxID=7260 RepID=UPI000732B07B|nr:lysozyme [Drosophila willistoni]KRF98111.1 uncharacterized protein Dwil_GK27471 [Drosophila willistoni]